jgi:phosphate acetyltransferase
VKSLNNKEEKMDIVQRFRDLAKIKRKTIVFPEGEEERVIKAVSFLKTNDLVNPIILGNHDHIYKLAKKQSVNLETIEIINPGESENYEKWVEKYYALRKHKGISIEQANEAVKNPLFYAAFLLRENLADGAVAGSINTTGDVLRAGIQVVGLAPEITVVSSSFIMALPSGEIFTFADCAVIPDPDPEQLMTIAISSSSTHERLIQEEPRVAMLSFSTKGSAQHEHADKVVTATNLIKEKAPHLKVDGELQFDAAYMESVGNKKAPGSPVAGKANVYIFPDLDAGNIGYKLTQRLAGAEALGPIIQGLNKPYNDLSRGCSIEDVINVACICAIIS